MRAPGETQHPVGNFEGVLPVEPVAENDGDKLIITEDTRPEPVELLTRPVVRSERLHQSLFIQAACRWCPRQAAPRPSYYTPLLPILATARLNQYTKPTATTCP